MPKQKIAKINVLATSEICDILTKKITYLGEKVEDYEDMAAMSLKVRKWGVDKNSDNRVLDLYLNAKDKFKELRGLISKINKDNESELSAKFRAKEFFIKEVMDKMVK